MMYVKLPVRDGRTKKPRRHAEITQRAQASTSATTRGPQHGGVKRRRKRQAVGTRGVRRRGGPGR